MVIEVRGTGDDKVYVEVNTAPSWKKGAMNMFDILGKIFGGNYEFVKRAKAEQEAKEEEDEP